MTIFLVTVLLLVTHAKTGLTVATVGIVAAILTLLANPAPLRLLRKVDWQTVLFFLGLFLTVSGLEQTGVLEAMANGIAGITGGNLSLMIVILIWLSAVASAFVDNIPFAATMVPVISSLSATMGVDLNTLPGPFPWARISAGQRHPHWGLGQCGRHRHCRPGGPPHQLGPLL